MSRSALQSSTSPAALATAWQEILSKSRKKSRQTTGVDGESISSFHPKSEVSIRRISNEIKDGAYRFEELSPHFITKPNGKIRLICVPTVSDRIVQRACLNTLSSSYGARFRNKVSFGFIRGRTVGDAARQACRLRASHEWAYKTDISNFFDEIDRDLLTEKCRRLVRQRSLLPLLQSALNCEIRPPSRTADRRIKQLGIRRGRGLRQGMPLSPFFANLFLEEFDLTVDRAGLQAVRYADDLIFFSDSETGCLEIDSFCREALQRLGLTVPPIEESSKTQVARPGQEIDFLGLGLCRNNEHSGYELRLTSAQIDRIRQDILGLGSIEEAVNQGLTINSFIARLDSKVAGFVSAYDLCSNIGHLEAELPELKNAAIRKVLGLNGLGINIDDLSDVQRKFLHLG